MLLIDPKFVFMFAHEICLLQIVNNKIYYNNVEINKVKFVGTPFTIKHKYMQVLDPFGIIEVYKKKEYILTCAPYILYCNVFEIESKVVFYLQSYTKINLNTKICIIQNYINNKK
ncbi:hypothetical protein BDAP_000853 [Binucleata daphniae]